jgi:hypothetical protein
MSSNKGPISDRKRAICVVAESLVAVAMAISGLLAVSAGGFLGRVGVVVLIFGAVALVQAIAAGLGLVTPRQLGASGGRMADAREFYCRGMDV